MSLRCGDSYNSSICLVSCITAESGHSVSETQYIAYLFKAVLVFLIWGKMKDFPWVWALLYPFTISAPTYRDVSSPFYL